MCSRIEDHSCFLPLLQCWCRLTCPHLTIEKNIRYSWNSHIETSLTAVPSY
jgi:hypothetical protein